MNNTTTTTTTITTTLDIVSLSTKDTVCIVLFALVSILGVFGNSLVIYVYGFAARKRFLKFERLMLILGIVDFLASITNPLLYIYHIATHYNAWHFGVIGCKILPALGPMFTNISLGIILVMAIDRDRSVSKPLREQFKVKTIYKAIFITVVCSILVCVPYSKHLKVYRTTCGISTKEKTYLRLILAIFITSDILFTIILGTSIARVYMKLSKQRFANRVSLKLIIKEYRKRETKKALKLIISIGVAFIVFIFPRDFLQIIIHISILYPPIIKIPDFFFINHILKILHTSNSCVNFFLYSAINKRFRREILRLIMKSPYIRKLMSFNSSNDKTLTYAQADNFNQPSRYSWKADVTGDDKFNMDKFIERFVLRDINPIQAEVSK